MVRENDSDRPPVDPPLSVILEPCPCGVRVIARGEIDLSTTGDVVAALSEAEAGDAAGIVLDLSTVTFIDSGGLQMLLQADARSRQDGNRLRIVPSPFVARMLDLSGLRDRLPLQAADDADDG